MPEQTEASAINQRINDLHIVKNELLEAKYQLIEVADRIESWPRVVLYLIGIKKNEYLSNLRVRIKHHEEELQKVGRSLTALYRAKMNTEDNDAQ